MLPALMKKALSNIMVFNNLANTPQQLSISLQLIALDSQNI